MRNYRHSAGQNGICLRGGSFLLALLLSPATLLIPAADDPQMSAVRRMEAKYRKATSLQSNFLERYFENGGLVRAESGVAFFRKPGKMRWEYQKPEKNLFLVDGKNAWFYTPVDHTATRIPARRSDDWRTPLAWLAGEGKLARVCERVLRAKIPLPGETNFGASDTTSFECVLKASASEATAQGRTERPLRVFLEITDNGELTRVVIQSSGGVLTEFRFKDWEIDPPLSEALFQFSPPPGVVIVEGLLPSSRSVRQ